MLAQKGKEVLPREQHLGYIQSAGLHSFCMVFFLVSGASFHVGGPIFLAPAIGRCLILLVNRMYGNWKCVFLLVCFACLIGGCKYIDPEANFIEKKKVWTKIKKKPRTGLEPSFVYAICHAESSLNANAETSITKGMMQLTEVPVRMLLIFITGLPSNGNQC